MRGDHRNEGQPAVHATGAPCASCGSKSTPGALRCAWCGAPRSTPLVIDGSYLVERELGAGGMGVVYLAKDLNLDRLVALKMIAPSWSSDPQAIASFQREAKALASVRHEHVVQVHALGLHEDSYFFAMEYVRGNSLETILREHATHGATIPIHTALTILERAASGLDAVHRAGIVHRDVKPANIIVEEGSGRPVIVDFGLAVRSDANGDFIFGGSPHYMAPEMSGVGPAITAQSDVYALGCTIFEILTGSVPFLGHEPSALRFQHAHEPVPPASSRRRDLAPFDAVLARALAKDPRDRHESCGALAAALLEAGHSWLGAPVKDEPAAVSRGDDGALRVLVVDDDPAFAAFAARAAELALGDRRVEISAAGSGPEAIAIAALRSPQLVTLDFEMPDLDGVGTLSRLRALPGGQDARILVVSGRLEAVQRWRFSVLGVKDFLHKPVDLRTLVSAIAALGQQTTPPLPD